MATDIENRKPQTRAELAAQIVERVESLGVKVDGSSRLAQMRRVLRQGFVPPDDPHFLTAVESTRDLYQLRMIVNQLEAHRDQQEFIQNVVLMLQDAALPQKSGQKTTGRNYQFHLYLAAVCLNGGHFVRHEEPDITCIIGGTKYGVAAKRLTSPRGLKDHVKKGADQIQRAGVPGIVALDLTIARNRKNVPMISPLWNQHRHFLRDAKNRQFHERYSADFIELGVKTGMLAVLTIEFTLRVSPEQKWALEGAMFWLPTTGGEKHAEQQFCRFQSGFLGGMPNVIDHSAED